VAVNLLELAKGLPEFSILVAAVEKAGLAETLAGDGPLTIMAPNDDAFKAAFKALGITAEEALENPALKDILLYHAIGKKVMAADVSDGLEVETLQGEKFTVGIKEGAAPTITGGDILPAAKVISTDIAASNGVVHVIDMMLIPPTISAALKAAATPNLLKLAESQTQTDGTGFNTLVAAVKKAGLAEALAGPGPLTIMAPNDKAFEAAFKALGITAEQALENPALGAILTYHAVPAKVMAADVSDGLKVDTVQGEQFTVNVKDGAPTITGGDILPAAKVIGTDIAASNGVVHVIDMMLVPPTISDALKAAATATTTSAPNPEADGSDTAADMAQGRFAISVTALLFGTGALMWA
jgi:transforming growth factor-beta-induced protein